MDLYCIPETQHTTVKHSQKLFEHTYTSNLYGLGTLTPIEFFQQDLLWSSSNTNSHSCSQRVSKHRWASSLYALRAQIHILAIRKLPDTPGQSIVHCNNWRASLAGSRYELTPRTPTNIIMCCWGASCLLTDPVPRGAPPCIAYLAVYEASTPRETGSARLASEGTHRTTRPLSRIPLRGYKYQPSGKRDIDRVRRR
jgi:hypothetical protein